MFTKDKMYVISGIARLITLRKICNHPDLSTGGPRVFTKDKMYVISGICWSDHST